MAKIHELLQPQYAGRFRCIGPECQDSCCHTWNVEIDKQTYLKYRRCPDLALRSALEKCVARNRSAPSDDQYAKIKLNQEGYCPLMDAEGLCGLQRTLGEDYLSKTCDNYPRQFHEVNGTTEMALTMSCPEAARIGLLNPAPMEFELAVSPYSRNAQVALPFNSDDPHYKNKAERYLWPLRVFIISLLQNRNYPLWQRLVILGFFCQAVQNSEVQGGETPAVIERYTRLVEQGALQEELDKIPTKYDVQLDMLRQLIAFRMVGKAINPRFVDCLEKVRMVTGLEGTETDGDVNNYKAALETYYRPLMAEHEYILENYLVNYAFKGMFPFGRMRLFDDYILMVVHYALIKMLLIGLAGHYKENFGVEHIVQLIYSFSRTFEHHDVYLREIYNMFQENKVGTMAYMAILIRS